MQTGMELDRKRDNPLQRETFGELLSELASNSANLIRDEIQLAKQEMKEKLVEFKAGAMLLAIASVIGLTAILTLTAAAVIGLMKYVGAGYAALIVGGALAIIGCAMGFAGVGKIKSINPRPEQTIETLEEDKRWLKELT